MKRNIRNNRFFPILVVIPLFLLLQSCGEDPFGPNFDDVPPPFVNIHEQEPDSVTTDGLQFYYVEEGSGPFRVTSNDQIRIRYTGRTATGDIFESTYMNGFDAPRVFRNLTPEPISTPNGPISPLIDGFRRGLLGMQEGEKRTIVVPPALGYGDNEDSSLKNDTLVFDVELVSIL